MPDLVLHPGDPAWPCFPAALRPPPALYLRGDPAALAATRTVAVVGSRSPPPWARAWARSAGEALARAGVRVVSGLARGIDGEAHAGCLAGGGVTVATLAHGLDRVYPPEHAGLARRIVEGGGALVTEYPPGTDPLPWRFVQRDRLQVAFARLVVVVFTEVDGGAMHTARFARKASVPVLVPEGGPPGTGAQALLADGRATRVADVGEVLARLP